MPEAVQTNGHAVNGATASKTNASSKEVQSSDEPVTEIFCQFVANTKEADINEELSIKLKSLLLDYFGVSAAAGAAADSTPKIIDGVKAFAGTATGNCTVLTKGSNLPPQYAALINGALCHSYDFDDTHAQGILHPGCALISAALADAEVHQSSGAELLLAMAVGYEVACRIGMALNTGSYARGFHTTATAGIFGSVAAVCKLRKSSQQVIENAFGLALSRAGGSMQFLDNGSWNKRLHPGFAAHDALLCVSLAEAGILGASKPLEGKYGVTALFSATGDSAGMTKDLGHYWTGKETACKPFPACRMTHGLLEMVGNFRKTHGSQHGLPQEITVSLPKGNFPIVGVPAPNKVRPVSIVDAQFSSYFQISAGWLYGNNLGWAIYEHIHDDAVRDLCERITVGVDESYKNLESRMKIVFEDGTVVEDEVIYPLAEPQRPFEWDTGVQKKFMGMAEPVYGRERAEKICATVKELEKADVRELMQLLA